MFAYLKRLSWEYIVPIVSMKVENYAELSLPRSAIERWNNESCLSIFQGSRMQAGDRLGREAAARPVDEILVSCADTYRSIRTLILIYSVWFHDARFFWLKIVFCPMWTWIDAPRSRDVEFLKKYEEKSWKSKGIYELEWILYDTLKGYLAQLMARKRSQG